jgi:hypothetical protein
MSLVCLPRHPAVAYLRLVRSMLVARLSFLPALLLITSCAATGPALYSDSTTVSAGDIQTAIGLVQQRCIQEKRGLLPVYRVDVDRSDRVFIHCGPHYGVADAAGALTFIVERKQGHWRITGMSRYTPNPERVIVT